MPTLLTLCVGCGWTSGVPLRAQLDELECVQRRLRLRAGEKLADRFLLATVALLDRPLLRAGDQFERGVRCRCGAVHGVVHRGPRPAENRLCVRPVRLGPLEWLVGQLVREGERLVDELRRLEQPVGDAELRDLPARQHSVLPQRIRHDHLDRSLRPDEPGQKLSAAPRGKEPEEDLRKRKVAHAGRDGSRRAVQRQLDTTTEAGAVDCRNGRERQRTQPAEQLVSRARTLARALGRDVRKLGDVCARRKDERLARDDRGAEVSAFELTEQAVERLERVLPEERRLRPVLAVVDRHEREVACPRELELSDRRQGSPTTRPRPYPCRRRARSARSARRGAP